MAENVLFPSLSENGWLDSTVLKADALFSHFITCNYSQSYIYAGKVTSFTYILQKYQGNIYEMLSSLQSNLEIYFSRYFTNVSAETTEIPNLIEPSKLQISIYVSFTDHTNKQFNLGKILEIADLKVQKIIDINNG